MTLNEKIISNEMHMQIQHDLIKVQFNYEKIVNIMATNEVIMIHFKLLCVTMHVRKDKVFIQHSTFNILANTNVLPQTEAKTAVLKNILNGQDYSRPRKI